MSHDEHLASVHPLRERMEDRQLRVEQEMADERRHEIERTFVEWHQDPYRLAKLWRWLCFRDMRPADPAYFIEHGEVYRAEYEAMCTWTGEIA